jgi:small subunit ribosomal protein S17
MMEPENRHKRKVKQGTVISNKMDKTVVVSVERVIRHPRYGKVMKRSKKYYAHHEGEPLEVGQKVTISETRPISKTKCWRVVTS